MKANGNKIKNTPIVVDLWNNCINKCVYFLSHCHSDHIVGLNSRWHEMIYTSVFNCWMLKTNFKVKPCYLTPLGIGERTFIHIKSTGYYFYVTLIDANHCPGSVMFLFEGTFGTILYTGDFRYDSVMQKNNIFKNILENTAIDELYLDNTYASPKCKIPSRSEVLCQIIDIIRKHPKHTISIGLRRLGKEEILREIALKTSEKIFVSEERMAVLKQLKYEDVFTTDPHNSRIHVLNMSNITVENMTERNKKFPHLTILPTALYRCGNDDLRKPYENTAEHGIHVVPYSDHSPYEELHTFVSQLRPAKLYPIIKITKTRNIYSYWDYIKTFNVIPDSLYDLCREEKRNSVCIETTKIPVNMLTDFSLKHRCNNTRTFIRKKRPFKSQEKGVHFDSSDSESAKDVVKTNTESIKSYCEVKGEVSSSSISKNKRKIWQKLLKVTKSEKKHFEFSNKTVTDSEDEQEIRLSSDEDEESEQSLRRELERIEINVKLPDKNYTVKVPHDVNVTLPDVKVELDDIVDNKSTTFSCLPSMNISKEQLNTSDGSISGLSMDVSQNSLVTSFPDFTIDNTLIQEMSPAYALYIKDTVEMQSIDDDCFSIGSLSTLVLSDFCSEVSFSPSDYINEKSEAKAEIHADTNNKDEMWNISEPDSSAETVTEIDSKPCKQKRNTSHHRDDQKVKRPHEGNEEDCVTEHKENCCNTNFYECTKSEETVTYNCLRHCAKGRDNISSQGILYSSCSNKVENNLDTYDTHSSSYTKNNNCIVNTDNIIILDVSHSTSNQNICTPNSSYIKERRNGPAAQNVSCVKNVTSLGADDGTTLNYSSPVEREARILLEPSQQKEKHTMERTGTAHNHTVNSVRDSFPVFSNNQSQILSAPSIHLPTKKDNNLPTKKDNICNSDHKIYPSQGCVHTEEAPSSEDLNEEDSELFFTCKTINEITATCVENNVSIGMNEETKVDSCRNGEMNSLPEINESELQFYSLTENWTQKNQTDLEAVNCDKGGERENLSLSELEDFHTPELDRSQSASQINGKEEKAYHEIPKDTKTNDGCIELKQNKDNNSSVMVQNAITLDNLSGEMELCNTAAGVSNNNCKNIRKENISIETLSPKILPEIDKSSDLNILCNAEGAESNKHISGNISVNTPGKCQNGFAVCSVLSTGNSSNNEGTIEINKSPRSSSLSSDMKCLPNGSEEEAQLVLERKSYNGNCKDIHREHNEGTSEKIISLDYCNGNSDIKYTESNSASLNKPESVMIEGKTAGYKKSNNKIETNYWTTGNKKPFAMVEVYLASIKIYDAFKSRETLPPVSNSELFNDESEDAGHSKKKLVLNEKLSVQKESLCIRNGKHACCNVKKRKMDYSKAVCRKKKKIS